MDVLLDDVVAGEPVPVDPVADHPLHVGPAVLPRAIPQGALISERAYRQHVADGAVEHAIAHFDARGLATQLRAGHHRESLGRGVLGRRQDGPHASGIHGDGLFKEAVLASRDSGRKVRRAEVWRRAVQHDIHARVDQLHVRVKAGEASALGHVDAPVFLQLLARRRDTIGEDIGQRRDLETGAGVEVVDHRAPAAATTPDETSLQRAALRSARWTQHFADRRLRARRGGRGDQAGRHGGDRAQKVTPIH